VRLFQDENGRGAMSKLAAITEVSLETMSRFKGGGTDLSAPNFRRLEAYMEKNGFLDKALSIVRDAPAEYSSDPEHRHWAAIAEDIAGAAAFLRSPENSGEMKRKRLGQLIALYYAELKRLGIDIDKIIE